MFIKSSNLKNKKAFTIAEMTVVLLILSIVMAAILPVATNKKTGAGGSSGSLWKLARNNTDVWFASPNSTQSVLIGTSVTPDSSASGRLNINIPRSTNRSQIAMMYNNTTVGYIKFKSNNNMSFGPSNPFPTALSGSNNTAIGDSTLNSLTSGSNNISIGNSSLRSLTTGSYNVAINLNALRNASTSSNNIGIGQNALYNATTGSYNVGIGFKSLYSNSSGDSNVGIGNNAGSKTTGAENTAVGIKALFKNTSGINNTAIGSYAGYGNTGSFSVYVGHESGRWNGLSGDKNIGIGYRALAYGNGDGNLNVGVGAEALKSVTKGYANVGIGNNAGAAITQGSHNIGIGTNSLSSLTKGSYNTGVGYNACGDISGSNKSCFGYKSGSTAPKTFSTSNNTIETIIGEGSGNIFLHGSKIYLTYGNQYANAAKASAGSNSSVDFRVGGTIHANSNITTHTSLTTGTTATIGTSATVTTHLTVGTNTYTNWLYTNEIRNRAAPNSYNTNIFGTFYGPWTPSSDKRLKNIEGFANTGLKEVKKLDVYKYTYKNDPKTQKIGLIAQDVQKVIPFAVIKGSDGYLAISQENIIYTMFNAIKELDKMYESLKTKIQDYIVRLGLTEDKINNLTKTNRDLTKRIDTLEKRINKLEKEYTKLEKQCKCK